MKSTDALIANTEYGTIVLNEKTGDYWHLNETAKFILDLLSSGATSTETAEKISEVFHVPLETAQHDVDSIHESLKGIGAL